MRAHPSKAAILSALSTALDLVEGQPAGHAVRTCAIALRIGKELGLSEAETSSLFYAAILKDSGCSSNSVRIHNIFGGDEILAKKGVKVIDWSSPFENVKYALSMTEPGQPLPVRFKRMLSNLGPPQQIMNEVTEARCTRGAVIARKLGFDESVAMGIHALDEHWDGKGSPFGVKGEEISRIARIICFSQSMEVFWATYGPDSAYDMALHRSGRWFDPEVVRASGAFAHEAVFWAGLEFVTFEEVVPEGMRHAAVDADIEAVCEAFAMIIDAKSSFTAEHSTRVAQFAESIGAELGFSDDRRRLLRRAGLLHDIGKLGVPSGILEKPGKLTDDEFSVIRSHPKLGYEVLRRVETFGEIAEIASAHHERLDGQGYWQGLGADQLTLEMRIMTVADVFDALSARRPYRDALSFERCVEIMEKDAGSAFDPECLAALWTSQQRGSLLAA
jgi:putative nucleotidyltransferase with HDIG domain